jgi:ABC-type transporter Mla MlaB component
VLSGSTVYDDGVLRITWAGAPPVLAIAGEVDESTYPGLVGALKQAADGPGEIHISLADVAYCDLAGLRAIVLLTGNDGHGHNGDGQGRRVVLHQVPAQLQTVLRIVGWDSVPGLALDGHDSARQPRPNGRSEAGVPAGGNG